MNRKLMVNRRGIVGVIGGVGPLATLDFFSKVLQCTPVNSEAEHLHLLIDNNAAVPDRTQSILGSGPSCAPLLVASALRLQSAGAGVVVMPCNTAHAYEGEIRAALSVPFLSIIEASCDAVARYQPVHAVGVLATNGCLQARLYQESLLARGHTPVFLDDERQSCFMRLVYAAKSGQSADPAIRCAMRELARQLVARGVQAIIAGCTEVPLLLDPDDIEIPLIDSAEALANRCIEWSDSVSR